jgi:hypothetical protein
LGFGSKSILNTGLGIGLSVSSKIFGYQKALNYLKSPVNNIKLLFPNLDFNYSHDDESVLKNFDGPYE